MEEEKDLLVFTDENGEDIEMEIVDYFVHDDEEYALLVESDEHEEECGCGCGCDEKELYIMKVIVDGETEEFVPVEEDKMDELIEAIERLYPEDEE